MIKTISIKINNTIISSDIKNNIKITSKIINQKNNKNINNKLIEIKNNKNIVYKEINKKLIEIKNNKNITISTNLFNQRYERQKYNNNIAFNEIKKNSKDPNVNNINNKALERLLLYTNYKNFDEIIKDKNNYEKNILKISSLYIAKKASKQGIKDEDKQLENINTLQEYDIIIIKDGIQKPIKTGGISKLKKKQIDELKSIDFIIKYKDDIIGYITAKITLGNGGHQDNVLNEIIQYCDWSKIQLQNDKKKVYIVLYDNLNTSKLYDDIKKKYKNDNILFTNTNNFKIIFLNWFNLIFKKLN